MSYGSFGVGCGCGCAGPTPCPILFQDDFNRGSLGSNYVTTGSVGITGNAVEFSGAGTLKAALVSFSPVFRFDNSEFMLKLGSGSSFYLEVPISGGGARRLKFVADVPEGVQVCEVLSGVESLKRGWNISFVSGSYHSIRLEQSRLFIDDSYVLNLFSYFSTNSILQSGSITGGAFLDNLIYRTGCKPTDNFSALLGDNGSPTVLYQSTIAMDITLHNNITSGNFAPGNPGDVFITWREFAGHYVLGACPNSSASMYGLQLATPLNYYGVGSPSVPMTYVYLSPNDIFRTDGSPFSLQFFGGSALSVCTGPPSSGGTFPPWPATPYLSNLTPSGTYVSWNAMNQQQPLESLQTTGRTFKLRYLVASRAAGPGVSEHSWMEATFTEN